MLPIATFNYSTPLPEEDYQSKCRDQRGNKVLKCLFISAYLCQLHYFLPDFPFFLLLLEIKYLTSAAFTLDIFGTIITNHDDLTDPSLEKSIRLTKRHFARDLRKTTTKT